MEGLCFLVFKTVQNKQYMQAFGCCCVWFFFFSLCAFFQETVDFFFTDSNFCGFLLSLGAGVDKV